MELLLALALATTLGVQGRANANVSIAAEGRSVAVVWSASAEGGSTDIYAAFSRDAGATFSTPSRVNSTLGAPRVGGEQPPRVSLVSRPGALPAIVVVWTERGTAGTTLVTAQSVDGGRTFGGSTVVPGTEAAGNRGWEAIAADGRGKVHAIWLDHRELAPPAGDATHAGHAMPMPATAGAADAVAKAQLSKLYFATLGDKTPAKAITGGVCYCCRTTLAAGADGSIYMAWRHVYAGNLRDIAFTVSRDGGRSFAPTVRVSEDKWAIDGCPENGPAIAIDTRNQVHVVWPTVMTGTGRGGAPIPALFYAVSRDGRSFTPRQAVPTDGFARHSQMVIFPASSPAGDQRLVIAWDEAVGNARKIVVARGSFGVSGKTELQREALSGSESGAYPALAATPEGVLVAWTSGAAASSVIRLTRLN